MTQPLSTRIDALKEDVTELYLDYARLAVSYMVRAEYMCHQRGRALSDLPSEALRADALHVKRFLEAGDWKGDTHFDTIARTLKGALQDGAPGEDEG